MMTQEEEYNDAKEPRMYSEAYFIVGNNLVLIRSRDVRFSIKEAKRELQAKHGTKDVKYIPMSRALKLIEEQSA